MLKFIAGLFIGSAIGYFIAALMMVAKDKE